MTSERIVDALGRAVPASPAARRVVSLVPSETETVAALDGGVERLVGRTEFCEEPAGRVEAVPVVGGTKSVDVDAVRAIGPDLVLANKEENGRRDVEALIEAGLRVHVSLPVTVQDAEALVRTVARLLGLPAPPLATPPAPRRRPAPRVFVPIWRDPWMTSSAGTYGDSVLRRVGAVNVFAERRRRYPLRADLGRGPESDAAGRDTRYPRITLEEIRAAAPDLVWLPDEPYRFGESDADELRALLPGARVEPISGKDLFWYGARTAGAIARLSARLDRGG